MDPRQKYRPYLAQFPVSLPDRQWPNRQRTAAPIWCSVDLRDGNQALINPMSVEQKLELFALLVEIGLKEIEIGFPAAARVEFDFTRTLIDRNLIPDDVVPQVLVQARPHLIDRTFESLEGARRAIVHMYNSTSELQRRVVFRLDRDGIRDLAVRGVERIRTLAERCETDVMLEYSPESFTGTELEFSLEICHAVMEVWEPSPDRKIILNLPSTVELATPNVYADQIEWFLRNVRNRESVVLSLHTHNDRGTGVAATELALLAGADRVEGTLFGNGERTGNVDLVTVALNLYTQGIDPKLDLSDVARLREATERCTEIPVHPRHPYAGDLVFAAFSGSHQDAIRKGYRSMTERGELAWEVPYLPVDPADIGRKYEPVIRINSQSGKGGVAFVMHAEFHFDLPRDMHPEFSLRIQEISEETGAEVRAETIWAAFESEYLAPRDPYRYLSSRMETPPDAVDQVVVTLEVEVAGVPKVLRGRGNGPIDACQHALLESGCPPFEIKAYSEHALSPGGDARAAAYVQVATPDGRDRWGVGVHADTSKAAIQAVLSAVNRAVGPAMLATTRASATAAA